MCETQETGAYIHLYSPKCNKKCANYYVYFEMNVKSKQSKNDSWRSSIYTGGRYVFGIKDIEFDLIITILFIEICR